MITDFDEDKHFSASGYLFDFVHPTLNQELAVPIKNVRKGYGFPNPFLNKSQAEVTENFNDD